MRTLIFLIGFSFSVVQATAQNPFQSIGKSGKLLTLSNGKYDEVTSYDSLQRVGSVIVNIKTKRIVMFLQVDTVYSEATLEPTIISRHWSIDPKAHQMPNWSPYSSVKCNPISYIDPDGAFPYTFHIRSFHPNATFGGGFMGDNRGFSNDPKSSARIAQRFTFDPTTGATSNKGFDNNFSMHPAGFASSFTPGSLLPSSMFIGKETPGETHFDVTGGNGSFNISTGFFGKNPLTPGIVTPAIDVHSNFTVTEDLNNGILSIGAKITGDAFPSAEAFLTDQSGNSVFIGVSGLSGNVLQSLWGDNFRDMIDANFNISIDKSGNFTGVNVGDKSFTLEEWNKQFETKSTEKE